MNWWQKFGCFLIGWNPAILMNCSEASHKALKKYTASILILVFIWGSTGYCFAERYLSVTTWWGCALTALAFIIIVIQIERQVILTVGKNKLLTIFRVILAVFMALIGSAILDQIIFKNDVAKVLIELRTDQARIISGKRQITIQAEINKLTATVDSLENINGRLNEEVAKHPTVAITNVTTERVPVTQPDGTRKMETRSTVSQQHVASTRIEQIRTNTVTINACSNRLEKLYNQKINVEETVRKELEENAGFLEELKAMIIIIKSDLVAGAFYFILFAFIFSLELLVVMSKVGDNKCDYDLIIEHQLNVKKNSLDEMVRR
jgi:hypothetical protein